MAKPVTKTPRSQEQRHDGYTFGCLWEQAKWPTGAPIQLPLEFCIFAKRLFYEKTNFKSSDCSAEMIHRSSWPIRYCLEKPDTHTHTQLLYPCDDCASRVKNMQKTGKRRLHRAEDRTALLNWLWRQASISCCPNQVSKIPFLLTTSLLLQNGPWASAWSSLCLVKHTIGIRLTKFAVLWVLVDIVKDW